MKRIILIILILILNLNYVSAFSLIGSGNCKCFSCSDCNNALNSSVCYTSVEIDNNIQASSDLCIDGRDRINFQDKNLDCGGYNVLGLNNYSGIFLYENHNNIIKNCVIDYMGVFFSNDIIIQDNQFHGYYGGLDLFVSDNLEVTNNIFEDSFYGIILEAVTNSEFKINKFYNNTYAISLVEVSNNNIFEGNIILDSKAKGIKILIGNNGNTFKYNKICNSIEYDIYNVGINNIGSKNLCDTFYRWKDSDADIGCSDFCIVEECFCDSCFDCSDKLNSLDCRRVILLNDIISSESCINGSLLENFSNKVFNCNNFNININDSGISETAIILEGNEGNSLLNCNIDYFENAVLINNSDYTTIDNFNINFNTNAIIINNSDNVFIQSSYIENNSEYGIYSERSNYLFAIDNIIYGNDNIGVKIYFSNFSQVIGNILVLNLGGLYISSSSRYTKIYQNIMCINIQKAIGYFDIENYGETSYGDKNTCDYRIGWNDEGISGCSNPCADEYETIESIINESDEDIADITEGINIEKIINEGLEGAGVTGSSSKLVIAIIFKIALDVILLSKRVQWTSLLIINFFILIFFSLIGWIPFWVSIVIMLISVGLFMMSLIKE